MPVHTPEIPSTTWLFRDPSSLMTGVKLVRENRDINKVAVIGCATGEQVYSLQTLFNTAAKRDDITIDGYDTKTSVLETAKKATYHPTWKHLRNKQLRILVEKLFGGNVGSNTNIIIPEPYRQGITFKYHDIRFDPLPTLYSLIYCSNLLSYFPEGTNPFHQPTLKTILWNISQSLDQQGILITEPPPQAANIAGHSVSTYLTYMESNPYFRSAPHIVVPIYEFITFPKRERFLAEETKAYIKKI
jgi:chemotaxis methyl-accepting protein methylase